MTATKSICFVVLLFLAGLAPVAWAEGEGEDLSDTERAAEYLKDGEFKKAWTSAGQAAKADPDDAEAWLYFGEAAFELKQWEASKNAYGKYLVLAPKAKNVPAVKSKLSKIEDELKYVSKQKEEENSKKAEAQAARDAEKAEKDQLKADADAAKEEKLKKAAELKEKLRKLEAGEEVEEAEEKPRAKKASAGAGWPKRAWKHQISAGSGFGYREWTNAIGSNYGGVRSENINQSSGVVAGVDFKEDTLPITAQYAFGPVAVGGGVYQRRANMSIIQNGGTTGSHEMKLELQQVNAGYDWTLLARQDGGLSDYEVFVPLRLGFSNLALQAGNSSRAFNFGGVSAGAALRWKPLAHLGLDFSGLYNYYAAMGADAFDYTVGKSPRIAEPSGPEIRFGISGIF